VQRALAGITKYEQSDGGITNAGKILPITRHRRADVSLHAGHSQQAQRIARAQAFLRDLQFDENEKIKKDNSWFGGRDTTARSVRTFRIRK